MISTIETIIIDAMAFGLPLFIMAVGGIFSEKSGVTNLCLEGFQGFGAFTGAFAVMLAMNTIDSSSPMLIYIGLIFAVLGGAVFAIIHAVLSVFLRADQVISGVVVNILSAALTAFMTSMLNDIVFGVTSSKFTIGVSPRISIPVISEIPIIGAFVKNMYPYEIIILILAVVMWYIMYKTRYGLRLRACGENPQSVDAAGGNVRRIRFSAVIISGAMSGIGGMFFAYMLSGEFSSAIYLGYGYLSVAALIFGNWNIGKTLLVCLFFGAAKSGGTQFAYAMELSSSFTYLFQTIPYILTLLLLIFFSKHNHPPKATGEFFDTGKR